MATVLLSGCVGTPVPEKFFPTKDSTFSSQHQAAVAFYEHNNQEILRLKNTRKEMVGLVVRCGDDFKYTSGFVGGMTNRFFPKVERGCKASAIVHTHPRTQKVNQNKFSIPDINTAKIIDVYLQSPDMKIRHADKNGVRVIRN